VLISQSPCSLLFLLYCSRNISRGVNNANDAQRFFLGVVDNPIIAIRLHEPEAQRQAGQVFPKTPSEGESATRAQAS